MDYKGFECPVCHEHFKDGEDVVVCPDCGTPHHRTCYESNGACANADKHREHYTWSETNNQKAGEPEEPANGVACNKCGYKNKEDALFCNKCGTPVGDNAAQTQQPNPGAPFGGTMPGAPQVMFDPMAGVNPEEEFAENVKAKDLAAIVKSNTPYFMTVFNKIRQFGSSRFSFAAFLFSGGWLLYRKQYVLGTIFTLIVLATTVVSNLYYYNFYDTYESIAKSLGTSASAYTIVQQAAQLPIGEFVAFFLTPAMELVRFAAMLICGFLGNRIYYKHCVKKIRFVKGQTQTPAEAATVFNKIGGVNKTLPIIILFIYMIANFAVTFFSAGSI